MLTTGILNPQLLSLISRVRHTNTIVIADYAFPFWPQIETVDLSLVQGIPRVTDVLNALLSNWKCGNLWMAEEFKSHNTEQTIADFANAANGCDITFEPHLDFKKRVPQAVGLIRTGDDILYANIILESA